MTAWYLGGVRITVVDLKEAREIIVAKLQPLSEGTYYQTFGNIRPVFTITAYVVGTADKASLEDMAEISANEPYTLVASGTEYSYSADFYVEKIDFQWLTSYAQSFRPDKPRTDFVYKAAITLDAIV
jgi:hypothetical protein